MKVICIKQYELIFTTYKIGDILEADKTISGLGHYIFYSDIEISRFLPNTHFISLTKFRNLKINKFLDS